MLRHINPHSALATSEAPPNSGAHRNACAISALSGTTKRDAMPAAISKQPLRNSTR